MSSKWNNAQKLQKTPKVCKKVPPPPKPNEVLFRKYPLQAHASWDDRDTPLEQKLSGNCTLDPHDLAYVHEGIIVGTRAHLELTLQWNRFRLEFLYTVSLYIGGVFQNSHSVTFTQPTAELPFEAGLFTWNDPIYTEHVESKIYS